LKKPANKPTERYIVALYELEQQRNSYVLYFPFCDTHGQQKKLIKEIFKLTEEINVLLEIYSYEEKA